MKVYKNQGEIHYDGADHDEFSKNNEHNVLDNIFWGDKNNDYVNENYKGMFVASVLNKSI